MSNQRAFKLEGQPWQVEAATEVAIPLREIAYVLWSSPRRERKDPWR